jgi:phosphonate transport system substrate-binding protein
MAVHVLGALRRLPTSLLLIVVVGAACTGGDAVREGSPVSGSGFAGTLSFSGIPDQNASRWARRYEVLEEYLKSELGIQVEGVPAADYAAVVLAFRHGDIQAGWFGGLTGVQARLAVPGADAIAQRPEDEQFHSVFVVNADVGVQTLAGLAGLTFTFGSESSTSGHLMPRHFLLEAGVDPELDFHGLPNFSGSHDTTWKLVESGAYQAGALSEAVWDRAINEGRVDASRVRELDRTPAYFDYNWTVRPDLDNDFGPGFTEALTDALLDLDDPDVLELFSTTRFIETTNENYEAIADTARAIGIVR